MERMVVSAPVVNDEGDRRRESVGDAALSHRRETKGVAMSQPSTSPHTTIDDGESIASDKLEGAVAIGVERNEPVHRIYYLWKLGRLPGVYKDGNRLIGSKAALRRAHRNRARTGK
jgi:hypothetical protein